MTETTSMNDTKGKPTMTNQDIAMQCKGLLGDCKGFSIDPKTKTVAFDMGDELLAVAFADLVSVEYFAEGYGGLGSQIWEQPRWRELRQVSERQHPSPLGQTDLIGPILIERLFIRVETRRFDLPIVDLVFLHAPKPVVISKTAATLKEVETWAKRLTLAMKNPVKSAA